MNSPAPAEVVVLGSGSHAKVVIDILEQLGGFEILGCVWPDTRKGHTVLGYPLIGDEALWPELVGRGVKAAIGVGGWTDNQARRELYDAAVSAGFDLVSTIHPSTITSSGVEIGRAACIYPGVSLNTEARLGNDVIVVTGATIDHETTVGDHALVSAGVALGAQVTVEAGALLAIGSTVVSNVTIGANALVAAGAVVIDDVAPNTTVRGVPARP